MKSIKAGAVICIVVIALVSIFSVAYLYPKIAGNQSYALITFTCTPSGITVKNVGTAALNDFTFAATVNGGYDYCNQEDYGGNPFPLSLAPQQSIATNWATLPPDSNISSGQLWYNYQHNSDYTQSTNDSAYVHNFTYSVNYGWYVRLTP